MSRYFPILILVNILFEAEGVCQCKYHMQPKEVIELGVHISIDMGQCKTRTKWEGECDMFKGWCYVDDFNTCSDSRYSNYGSPYNWSCQACRESTEPYPAPRKIKVTTRSAPSKTSKASAPPFAIVGSLVACLCIAVVVIFVLMIKRRRIERKSDEETKAEFNPMYGQYYFDDGTQCPNEIEVSDQNPDYDDMF